jgi:hypothetical protein
MSFIRGQKVSSRWERFHRRRSLVVVLAGPLLVACSASGGGGDDGEVASAEAPSRTANTQPEATDPEAVRPYIEDLLARYDEVVNQIIADPSVAEATDDPLIEEYLSLFEPDSQFAHGAIEAWVSSAEAGRTIEPYTDDRPALATSLVGELEVVADDEVEFPICIERRQSVYEGDVLKQETPYFLEPGTGVAARADGEWLLRRLDRQVDIAGCTGVEEAP